jgi:hypothetical protein
MPIDPPVLVLIPHASAGNIAAGTLVCIYEGRAPNVPVTTESNSNTRRINDA